MEPSRGGLNLSRRLALQAGRGHETQTPIQSRLGLGCRRHKWFPAPKNGTIKEMEGPKLSRRLAAIQNQIETATTMTATLDL